MGRKGRPHLLPQCPLDRLLLFSPLSPFLPMKMCVKFGMLYEIGKHWRLQWPKRQEQLESTISERNVGHELKQARTDRSQPHRWRVVSCECSGLACMNLSLSKCFLRVVNENNDRMHQVTEVYLLLFASSAQTSCNSPSPCPANCSYTRYCHSQCSRSSRK